MATAAEALDHAKRTLTDGTAEEKAAETALLQTAYDALAEAIDNGAKAPLRDRLQELIVDTEALLAKVVTGTLEYHSGLQTEGAGGPGYSGSFGKRLNLQAHNRKKPFHSRLRMKRLFCCRGPMECHTPGI